MRKISHGFTIVELLVVIVVIAILASISLVAYTGVQNRAYASSVTNDLATIAKKMELYRVASANEMYPTAADSTALKATLEVIDIKLNTASYSTTSSTNALFIAQSDGLKYAFLARPKNSATTYFISSSSKVPTAYTGTGTAAYPGGTPADISAYLQISPYVTSYIYSSGAWRYWN